MENRRLLGEEEVTLVNGENKTIKIYDVGFIEKMNIVKRHTKKEYIKGLLYKDVDEGGVLIDVLEKALEGVNLNELGYNSQKIYEEYFGDKSDDDENSKKEKSSTIGQKDTE